MNQEKIGKFILNLRKKNNLSQSEFANILGVTSQAVSKWENARGIPDIELIKKISEEFNVDINDLINGSYKRKNNKKIFIILIILVLSISTSLLLINSQKETFKFMNITSENSSFKIKGVAAFSKDKKSIYISEIEYLDKNEDVDKYLVIECALYEVLSNTEKKISQCGKLDDNKSEELKTLDELLKNIEFHVDNFESECKGEAHNLYITINALNQFDKVITYKVPIILEDEC